MTEPQHDRDPVDPALDAAWRAHSREDPPAHLDAAILAAAHRASGARPRDVVAEARGPWRWWWPLAAAATIGAIAIGVIQLLPPERDPMATIVSDAPRTGTATRPAAPRPRDGDATQATSRDTAPGTAAVQAPVDSQRRLPASAVPSTPQDAKGASPPAAAPQAKDQLRRATEPAQESDTAKLAARREAPAALAKDAPDPFPGGKVAQSAGAPPPLAREEERKTERQVGGAGQAASAEDLRARRADAGRTEPFASAERTAAPAPPPAAESVPRVAAAPAPLPAATPSLAPAMPQPGFAPSPAAPREQVAARDARLPTASIGALAGRADNLQAMQKAPDEFVATIRRLHAEGRLEEAAKELAEFRKAYPDADARLPPELRSWAATVR